ncbi:MAG: aspartate kinase, partial [Vibrio sp.]
MSQFDAVMNNIFLRPEDPYQRIFVVSAYAGVTDALLEAKRGAKPGIYALIAAQDDSWQAAFINLEQQLLEINQDLFESKALRSQADDFVRERIVKAKACIENILATCQYGQFSLEQYLPQIREFLSSIGEAHSAFNSYLKLNSVGIKAEFVDLSGWQQDENQASGQDKLDQVILNAMQDIDLSESLPIVTGYVYCDEGLMKTYDRGYSEMTFSRLAVLTKAKQAIIHK